MTDPDFFTRAFADPQFRHGKLEELSMIRKVSFTLGMMAAIGGIAFCVYTKLADDCWTTGFPLLTLGALCGGLYAVCSTRITALRFLDLLSGLSDPPEESRTRSAINIPPGAGDV